MAKGGATVRRLRNAVVVAICAAVLTSCGDGGETTAPETDPPASAYAARINGPSSAEPDAVVVLTLSNVGQLRDSYQLTATPPAAAVIGQRHLTIEPGRSAKFRIKVKRTPVTINVESAGAGPEVDAFTIR
jgi:hypothetical protein